MPALALSRATTTPLTRVRSRSMPTPRVQSMLVSQPINLRPMGNTVSLTVPAENPFTGGRAITILTQASGGMAQADPTQRSLSIRTPFSGLAGDLEDRAYAAFNKMDPAAGSTNRAAYDTSPSRTYWEQTVAKWDADKAAASSANWSKAGDIFSTTLNASANVASQLLAARKAASDAQAANSMSLMARLSPTNLMANMGRRKSIAIPLLAVAGAALAVALVLFLKKKGASSASA